MEKPPRALDAARGSHGGEHLEIRALVRKIDFHPGRKVHDRLFLYLLAASAFLRLLWLDKPVGSLIFDERWAQAHPS